MAVDATALLRVFRNFVRFTGDGKAGEPTNAPLPVGDPQSGVFSPTKAELRQAFIDILEAVAAAAGVTALPSWEALAAETGTRPGQPGRVTTPAETTHTGYSVNSAGMIVSGPGVPDRGEYSWSANLSAWVRTGDVIDPISLQADLQGKAPLASPAFSGTPTGPTAAPGTNTQQFSTTAFVQAAIAALVDASPGALDTLNELAAALGNDPNFAATIAASIGLKAPLASPALTGTPTAPNASAGTNTGQIANTAFVQSAIVLLQGVINTALAGKAPLASPVLTGTPVAPTAAPGTSTQQLANTAFVQAALAALVDASPATLDTLNELAAALGDDPNFAATMTSLIGTKAPLASPALTGAPTAPTPAPGATGLEIANAAFVEVIRAALDAAKASQSDLELEVAVRSAVGAELAEQIFPASMFDGNLAGLTDFHFPFYDAQGNVVAGLGTDYNWYGNTVYLPGVPTLSPHLWSVIVDSNEAALYIDPAGVVVAPQGFSTGADPVVSYEVGGFDRLFIAAPDTLARLSYGAAEESALDVKPGKISYLRKHFDNDALLDRRIHYSEPTAQFSAARSKMRVIGGHGQSLSLGNSSALLTNAAIDAGIVQMFASGQRLHIGTSPVADLSLRDLINACETGVETPMSRMAHQHVLNGLAADSGLITFAAGVGGSSYASLKKGTAPYEGLIRAFRRAKVIANLRGQQFLPPISTFTQGENNQNNLEATYKGYLIEHQVNLTVDLADLLDAPAEILLFVDQISNFTKYQGGIASSFVPLAQLNAALENPSKIVCVMPKYILPTVADGVHLTGESSALLGEYHGLAQSRVLAGLGWKPTHIASTNVSGSTITTNFATPENHSIVIDPVWVSNPGNFGFELLDTSATITGVSQVGDNQIAVAFTGALGATAKLGVAFTGTVGASQGPTTGPRSCIRDTSPRVSSRGFPMYNPAAQQRVTL